MKRPLFAVFAALLTVLAEPALAHTGAGPVSGATAGFGHPLGGLDHLLAMVAVGMLGAQLGGRALWAVPGAFVAAMVVGGVLGMAGVALPFVETGIVGSVIVLGLVIAWGKQVTMAPAMALAAVFALFHGHAHGTEMPAVAAGLEYAAGFVAATALLHALGVGIGLATSLAGEKLAPVSLRFGGGAIAAAGVALVVL